MSEREMGQSTEIDVPTPMEDPDGHRARLFAALTRRTATITGSAREEHPLSAEPEDDLAASPDATRLLETLVAFAGDMLLVVGPTGTILFASPSVQRYLGHDPLELVGDGVFSFIDVDDIQPTITLFAEALARDMSAEVYQTIVTTASGEPRWVEAITINLIDDPAIGGFVTTLRDVTDRVTAEMAAVRERQRFEDLVDSLPDVIVRLDLDLRPTYGNAAARATDPEWLSTRTVTPAAFALHDDRTAYAAEELNAVLSTGEPRTFETSIPTRSGEIWLSSMAMPERDATGEISGILVVTRDVTAYRVHTEELTRQALEDPLTGLANRSRLEAELERALYSSAENGTPTGVIFADLDEFKEINDIHGHAVGDQVLKAFARRAREALRPSDLVARFGGDEFVVLPSHIHVEAELESLGARLHDAVRDPFEVEGRTLSISLSIGIATAAARSGLSSADLLGRADQAMYASKRRGRNQSTVWSRPLSAVPHIDP